ncbi:CTP synthetase [Ruegeria lacuscaerulensis]|uniref:CTP synthetase n=1 Tax=Ruegeria lacuscaerulensis TaxID=55218 RepID=UPI00147A1744|nr:CTP synthetase [Ruegeria lacuscaerulensis]
MFRLATTLYAMISTALAGTAVIAVLVAGTNSVATIVLAAALGFALAAPVSWRVARDLYNDAA